MLRLAEPLTAVGDPPAQDEDGDGEDETPHQGESEVGDQAECKENRPKYFLFHEAPFRLILAPTA